MNGRKWSRLRHSKKEEDYCGVSPEVTQIEAFPFVWSWSRRFQRALTEMLPLLTSFPVRQNISILLSQYWRDPASYTPPGVGTLASPLASQNPRTGKAFKACWGHLSPAAFSPEGPTETQGMAWQHHTAQWPGSQVNTPSVPPVMFSVAPSSHEGHGALCGGNRQSLSSGPVRGKYTPDSLGSKMSLRRQKGSLRVEG